MKVSVIIPTYNRAHLIREAIDSVLAQTFEDFELIVVDDGSTDDTAQRLGAYGNRLLYVRQPNGGVNAARNTGLSLATGEYIALLDSDDLWQPWKLELQIVILDRFPDLAYIYSNFSLYRSADAVQGNGIQSWYPTPKDWSRLFAHQLELHQVWKTPPPPIPAAAKLYFGTLYHASLNDYFVLPSTAVFRRKLLPASLRLVEYDPICGDWDFFARLSRDHPICYLDLDTTHNRCHEDAVRLTRTRWKQQLEFRIDMLERLYLSDLPFYRAHHDEVDAVYCDRLSALSRQQLLSGERQQARQTLRKYRAHCRKPGLAYRAMVAATHLPGIGQVLRTARQLRG